MTTKEIHTSSNERFLDLSLLSIKVLAHLLEDLYRLEGLSIALCEELPHSTWFCTRWERFKRQAEALICEIDQRQRGEASAIGGNLFDLRWLDTIDLARLHLCFVEDTYGEMPLEVPIEETDVWIQFWEEQQPSPSPMYLELCRRHYYQQTRNV